MSLTSEMRGIAPRTSGLISGRSTNWPTTPKFRTVEQAFDSVRKQEVIIFLGRYFLYKISIFGSFLKKVNQILDVLNFGDSEYCSPYFWLDKWALYHLTFIPITIKSRGSFFRLVSNYEVLFFVRRKSTC